MKISWNILLHIVRYTIYSSASFIVRQGNLPDFLFLFLTEHNLTVLGQVIPWATVIIFVFLLLFISCFIGRHLSFTGYYNFFFKNISPIFKFVSNNLLTINTHLFLQDVCASMWHSAFNNETVLLQTAANNITGRKRCHLVSKGNPNFNVSPHTADKHCICN